MSEADGSIPGTSIGYPGHPPGTHENGKDIDTAYYQLYAKDNMGRPVGVHYESYYDAYHLVEAPYALDNWRAALYLTYLAEHPRLRVIGVDGQIGLALEDTFDELVEREWLSTGVRDIIPLAYEVEDTGMGWYQFHHHHMHVSINPVHDIVSSLEINPDTLNRKSFGRYVTSHIEFKEGINVNQINKSSVALIVNGNTMVYAQPKNVKFSDYNHNGIDDITIKFDRREFMDSIENGYSEISITGLIGDIFFQESDVIRVIGDNDFYREKAIRKKGNPHVPFIRPGGRNIASSE